MSEPSPCPLLVLVHGANHQSVCWDPTVAVLADLVPDGRILAVDLPGRGADPGPVDAISFDAFVRRVVEDIDATTTGEVVLVGHSLGGVTICGVAEKLGSARVRHLVFVAATIPPEGSRVLDTFGVSLRLSVPLVARRRKLTNNPRWTAATSFCNGMTAEQRAFVLDNLCPDAPWLLLEPFRRTGLSPDIERTWVLTTRDKAVRVAQQHRNIANLGGVADVIEIDSGHDVMVSEPRALADAIVSCWRPAT